MESILITAIITIIITVVLSTITAWYAYSTYRLLEESRKQRTITYLGERLSNLYSPLVSNIDKLTQWPPFHHAHPEGEEYWTFWQEIRKNVHLGSEELREALLEFIWSIDNPASPTGQEKATEYREIIQRIANEEFNQIKDNLNYLMQS